MVFLLIDSSHLVQSDMIRAFAPLDIYFYEEQYLTSVNVYEPTALRERPISVCQIKCDRVHLAALL